MNWNKISPALAILAGVLWGGAGIFIRILSAYGMDSISILVVKSGIAALLMLGMILVKDPALLKLSGRNLGYLILLALVGITLLNYFYNSAVVQLSLSLTTVIFSLSVFMVPIISSWALDEHLSWRQYFYMGMAVLGCAMVSGLFDEGIVFSLIGVGLAFASSICNAVYNVTSKKILNGGCHTYTLNFYALGLGTLFAAPFADWGVITSVIAQDPAVTLTVMISQSILMSLLPGILYIESVKRMNTATATALEVGCEPPASMIFGLLLFAEVPSPIMIVGLIIVVAALVLMSKRT